MQCNAKELAFLRSLPSASNFGGARVTQKRVQCNARRLLFCVHCRVQVTSAEPELRKKRVQCNARRLAFLRSLPSASNFGGARVTQKRVQCNARRLLFCVHCRVQVTSAEPELRKNECNAMPGGCFFAFIATLYIIFESPSVPPNGGRRGL